MGALADIRLRLMRPNDLLVGAGLYMKGVTQAAFRAQGRPGVPTWKDRDVPNVVGIIEDIKAGRTPPERRWESRPANIDTGALRQSVTFEVVGTTTVQVGSWLPYASKVQAGGESSISIPDSLAGEIRRYIRSRRGGRRKALQLRLKKALRIGAFNFTKPPRPFLMVTKDDRARLIAMARRFIFTGAPGSTRP